MANTFVRHPIDHADLNVWGPKNTTVLESVTGICTAYLYLSAGTMYISTGKIGIVDTPSGTNGIGVVNISAAESIAHAGTNGIWKRVYMTVSGSTASFAIADMAGETSADVLPDTLFNAYVPVKGGYYVNNNARDIGAVWVDAGGNALYVITDKTTVRGTTVLYAEDASGLMLVDDGGNMGLCVEDGGNVGINTRNPTLPMSINGSTNLIAATTETRYIAIGDGRTGNGETSVSLISDATYTNYGTRLFRGGGGENAESRILHRGTGNLVLQTTEAANIVFNTSATARFKIAAGDMMGGGGYAGGANRDFYFYMASDTYEFWDESASALKYYIAGAFTFMIYPDNLKLGGATGGVNRDVQIDFASDASQLWDESEDEFYFNKTIRNTGNINVGGNIIRTGIPVPVFYDNVGGDYVTEDEWFDLLDPYIPSTNDVMQINGCIRAAGTTDMIVLSHAIRTDASTITIYGCGTTSAIGEWTDTLTNGSATNFAAAGMFSF